MSRNLGKVFKSISVLILCELTVVVVDVGAHYPHGAVSDLPGAAPLVLPGYDPQRLPVL